MRWRVCPDGVLCPFLPELGSGWCKLGEPDMLTAPPTPTPPQSPRRTCWRQKFPATWWVVLGERRLFLPTPSTRRGVILGAEGWGLERYIFTLNHRILPCPPLLINILFFSSAGNSDILEEG